MPRSKKFNEYQSNYIIENYQKGLKSSYELSREFSCSNVHVLNFLKRNKIKPHSTGFFNIGKASWNKGLTKEDSRVKKYSDKLIGNKCYKNPERSRKISLARTGKPSWNKGVYGEEYLNHFQEGQAWNKGLTKEKDDRVLAYAQKKMGKTIPIDTRVKISKTKLQNFKEGKTIPYWKGKKNHSLSLRNTARFFSEGTRSKMSKTRKELINSGKIKVTFPIKDSSPERKVQEFLADLKIFYLKHHYFSNIDDPYQCDIFIPSMNLVIECDGDYWHGNLKRHGDWSNLTIRQKIQKIRDYVRTEQIEHHNFKVLRLWESDIKRMDIERFSNLIKEKVVGVDKVHLRELSAIKSEKCPQSVHNQMLKNDKTKGI